MVASAVPALPADAEPQSQTVAAFRLDGLHAARIEAPTGTPAQLHWVLAQIPSDEQVIFPDPEVRRRVSAVLARWGSESNQHAWVLEGSSEWNLINQLNRSELSLDYTFDLAGPADLHRPPQSESSVPSKFEVRLRLTVKPHPKITSIAISVKTASAEAGESEPITLAPQTLAAVAEMLHRPRPDGPEAAIVTTLTFTRSDQQAFGTELIQQVLSQVPLDAAEMLKNNGWRGNYPRPTGTPRLIEETIEQQYELSGGGFQALEWPRPAVDFTRAAGTEDWTLRITGLQPVRDAIIRVAMGKITASEKSMTELQQKTDIISARLNQRYEAVLARLRNRIVTRTELEAVTTEVAQSTEIQRTVPVVRDACPAGVAPECRKPALVLEPVVRWNVKTLALKADGSFSAEEFVTGQFRASGDNLMSFRETESAELKGGPEMQKASALLDRHWTHGDAVFGLHGGFNWMNDFSQRLGGLTRTLSRTAGAKYEITDWSLGAKTTARLAPAIKPMPDRTAQWRPVLEAEVGFELRDTELRDKQFPVRMRPDSGSTAAVTASVRPRLRRESFRSDKSGFAVVDFDSQFGVRKAFPVADFAFTQWQASVAIAATFGARRSTDFLLRHRRGVGVTNGPAPLFQLFRLGGAASVRGIEEGEYVGRYHAFEQSEAGVAIQRLIEVFRPPKPPHEKTANAKPPRALNLATTYVKVFYDRGATANTASAANLLAVSHAAHGYGVAAEVSGLPVLKRRASLTIGYGRSPQSLLHRSGMIITGVSIEP